MSYSQVYNVTSLTALLPLFSLHLSLPFLASLSLSPNTEATGSPLPAQFTHLQQLQESFSRIMVLKIITDKQYQLSPTTTLSLEPFRAVHSLIVSLKYIQKSWNGHCVYTSTLGHHKLTDLSYDRQIQK